MCASSPRRQGPHEGAGSSSSWLCGRPTASHRGRKRKAVVESKLTSYLRESDERDSNCKIRWLCGPVVKDKGL
ncbi:hypothetical protein AOXY_G38171 [Acipenser oxyrinchus oxyrinchus]|uniref:Uncharacterized protein n=1 Tax=Acipenser oxyrinchus oxyrinchus TaxID=40147 RepID=A0AAD8CDD7_ACIOX|nr:hypothetical protein AOXY_G38171 [Acipenser oxyrinchus oxyrinchus]